MQGGGGWTDDTMYGGEGGAKTASQSQIGCPVLTASTVPREICQRGTSI